MGFITMTSLADEGKSLSACETSNGDDSDFDLGAGDLFEDVVRRVYPVVGYDGGLSLVSSSSEVEEEPVSDDPVRDHISRIFQELKELRARDAERAAEAAELKETVAKLEERAAARDKTIAKLGEENRKLRDAVEMMAPGLIALIDSDDELREYSLDARRRRYKSRDNLLSDLGMYGEVLIKMADRFESGGSPGEVTELRIGALLNTLTKNGNAPLYVPWIQKHLKTPDGETLTDRQMKTLRGHLKKDSRFEVKRCPGQVKNWIWQYRHLEGLKGEFVWLAGQDVNWRDCRV